MMEYWVREEKETERLFFKTHHSNIPLFHCSSWWLMMAKIEINQERCKGCGLCTISCPKELIQIGKEINRQGYFYVCWDNNGKCTGCAICGEICPDIAISVWK
jgi:2-oxoglutarate ferredoxin oxidoreductase subunit delta